MPETRAKFLSGSTFRHVAVMSAASSVGLMAVFLVDFVDMLFISMLGKEELAAAIGYAGAILFFTGSFGIGLAVATGALVARALGAGTVARARELATHAMLAGFSIGAVFAAVVWINGPALIDLLGASGETRALSIHFLRMMLPSLPILLLGTSGGAVLRAYGDARRSMMVLISGGVVNAVLDPILIFGLDLELTGAAIASIIARCVIAASALASVHARHRGFAAPVPRALWQDLRPVAAIAGPAILTQLATPVGLAYVTRAMASYGEAAVAGMAVVNRLIPVAFGTVFALSGAVGPIIGQNAGAGQSERVKSAFRDGLLFAGGVILVVSGTLFVLRGIIAEAFHLDGIGRDLLFLFAGPLSLLWFFNSVMFVSNAAFNNLGKPLWSTLLNWGRHTLGTVPFVLIGAEIWGARGVLIGQAAGGVLFGTLSALIAWRLISRGGGRPGDPGFAPRHRVLQYLMGRR